MAELPKGSLVEDHDKHQYMDYMGVAPFTFHLVYGYNFGIKNPPSIHSTIPPTHSWPNGWSPTLSLPSLEAEELLGRTFPVKVAPNGKGCRGMLVIQPPWPFWGWWVKTWPFNSKVVVCDQPNVWGWKCHELNHLDFVFFFLCWNFHCVSFYSFLSCTIGPGL